MQFGVECLRGTHAQIPAEQVATAFLAVLYDSEGVTEDNLCPLRGDGWCVPYGAVSTPGGGGIVLVCVGGNGLQIQSYDGTASSGGAHSFQLSDSTPTHRE